MVRCIWHDASGACVQLFLVSQWAAWGVPLMCLWCAIDVPVVCLWCACGIPEQEAHVFSSSDGYALQAFSSVPVGCLGCNTDVPAVCLWCACVEQEAHVFSSSDGYALQVFVVTSPNPHEEVRNALRNWRPSSRD